MSRSVKQYRLNRLFHATSGRCFDVAVDHGMPGEPAMLTGIEDMAAAIDTLVDAAPDAIQLSVGQADLLQRHPGRDKPALVLRTDTPNIYAPEPPVEAWSFMIDDPVGHAVRLDAACVVVNLLDVPGQDGLRRDCLEAISHLRAECDRVGMPLMVEPLAFEPGEGGYSGSGDVDRICGIVRQAVELGRRHHQGRPDRRPRRLPPRRHRRRACRCWSAAAAGSPTRRSSSARMRCSSRARPASSTAAT